MLTTTLTSYSEVARALRSSSSDGSPVRIRGGGSKLGWGGPGPGDAAPLSTLGLDEILEHNAGDLTAVIQAGVRLADAQKVFAQSAQMLALDPPLGSAGEATIGGVVATADSGPLRHRYGGVRDQLIGIRVALADGSVAHSGGKVIKNVAGYDLAKLFAGSFGTLGVILEVSVRLHPLSVRSVTVVGSSDDPEVLQRGALALSNSPVQASSLDFAWEAGHGSLLARFSGRAVHDQALRVRQLTEAAGLETTVEEEDEGLWERQRAAQRSTDRVVVKVSGLAADLAGIIRTAEGVRATIVGRAGLGIAWLCLREERTVAGCAACVEDLRASLAPHPVVVQDFPRDAGEMPDVWGRQPESSLALMRRLKDGFDPAGICNRGIFVGGI